MPMHSAAISLVTEHDGVNGNRDANGTATATLTQKSDRTNTTTTTSRRRSNRNKSWHIFASWMRFLMMDVVLLVVLLLYAAMNWFSYVQRAYIIKQAHLFHWSSERMEQEHTYYNRYCDAFDLSTNTTADLFAPRDDTKFTPHDTAAIQLQHGFTFIENVLSPHTMQELRNTIQYRNHHDKQLFVISAKHRFNILLGTEDRSVRNALVEIANHKSFKSSLEAMLGPNPALVELTAITSSAGAKAQYWHEDVNEASSATNYMQSFGPVYSVFIQLQNTTKAMGATSICPGSHYCTQGPIGAYCEEANIQAVHSTTGYSGGDALIMNMNSYHRGSAHVDHNAPDRVMLILSFTPQPKQRAERRQLSSGFTYQLRWDMWGHTLNDMATAHTSMRQPWATLRSFGLYKPRTADWGIDYIMQSTQRILHSDNGFARYNLDSFIEEGGFPFLPSFLQATNITEDESWYEFLRDTMNNCIQFTEKAAKIAIVTYTVLVVLLWVLSKSEQKILSRLTGRFALIISFIGTFIYISKELVDQSDWAKDIILQQKYASTVPYDQMMIDQKQTHILSFPQAENRTTLPNRYDVLIETRFGSRDLGMYNHFLDGHPGNALLRKLIDTYRSTYNNYSPMYQQAIARYVRESVETSKGRFLYQFPVGMWGRINEDEAESYVAVQLWLASHPVIKKAIELIRYGVKDVRYGIYRDAALARYHIPNLMNDVRNKILRKANFMSTNQQMNRSTLFKRIPIWTAVKVRQPLILTAQVRGPVLQNGLANIPKLVSVEPTPDAWIEQGDMVEVFIQGFWYGSEVLRVTADGYYHFVFIDGDDQKVTWEVIRRIHPVKPQEMVEVYMEDGLYHKYEILEEVGDGSFVGVNIETKAILEGITPIMWRRTRGKIKLRPDPFSSTYPPTIVDADLNDYVEVLYEDDQWFTGQVTDIKVVDEENEYEVSFIDNTTLQVVEGEYRTIRDYEIGETIFVYIGEGYFECEFLGEAPDGTYRVRDIADDVILEQITSLHIGRKT